MHKKLWLHLPVLIIALVSLTVLRLFSGGWQISWYLLWWWLGAALGFGFVFADRLVHLFMVDPTDPYAKFVKALLTKGRFSTAITMMLADRNTPQHLFMRSVLFLVTWVLLGLLAMTSSVSPFGRGFVLGVGLHLTFDLLADYLGKAREIQLWFWQIKRELAPQEITAVVWGFVILFLVIGLML